jgi:poly-beta-1,6-N-acetyl-D-glucosamine synthase
MTTLLVVLGAAAAAGHVLYPGWLWLATRHRPDPPLPPDPRAWPAVTVVIPAFRESGVIAAKVAAVRAEAYPGSLEVLVVAEDGPTADAARAAGGRVVQPDRRLGKAQALNAGIDEASTPVVVLTDANAILAPGSVASLVRHLGDPTVGAVAGRKTEADDGGEELYSRFERWLKAREWRMGTTIGASGELVAVRRACWRPIPVDVSMDDLWLALDLSERGVRVAYEPSASAVEPGVPLAESWERRTRITATLLYVIWRKRALLRRRDLVAVQIVGHKLWRSTGGPLCHALLLAIAARRAGRSRLAASFVLAHAVGGAGLVARARGRRLPAPLRPLTQVLYLQLVALGGMVRLARGDRAVRWPKPAR